MSRVSQEEVKVELTPMIDVVFQLLIFFVVTLKVEDILSRLMATRPAPDPNARKEEQPELIDITVHKGGFLFKGKVVSYDGLDSSIARYARLSKNANVIIRCTKDSRQRFLVQVLDICNKHKMTNLSIFSM